MPGQFYFLCVVFDYPGRVFTVFIDRLAVETDNIYETGGSLDCATIQPGDFSRAHQTGASLKSAVSENWCGGVHQFDNYFRGLLDEIRFYDRALLPDEILALYQRITAIEDEPEPAVPQGFVRRQNYPNPFNPGTTISCLLPRPGTVKLTLFDMTGREIRMLLNGYQSAGEHQLNFTAGNLASGNYLYRLTVAGPGENVQQTRMITLLK